tara:strand:+ start:49 stop:246 length:198 start_codon:yes stop_codon:yes gene_type:complete
MKPKYTVTRICELHEEIEVQAKNDKEIMELYHDGSVDEILSTKNESVKYVIKDKNGKIIHEHTFT